MIKDEKDWHELQTDELENFRFNFSRWKNFDAALNDSKLAETWTNSTPFSGQFPFFFQPEFFQNP